jgi:hypothetical protein
MEMVRVGGHYLGITEASNFSGHGFYQFSPELFFRVFAPENGFTTERMLIRECARSKPWYRVVDPKELKTRVEFRSTYPAYLMVQARRVSAVSVLASLPQQSDYVCAWAPGPDGAHTDRLPLDRAMGRVRSVVKALMPVGIVDFYRSARAALHRFDRPDPSQFRRTDIYLEVAASDPRTEGEKVSRGALPDEAEPRRGVNEP